MSRNNLTSGASCGIMDMWLRNGMEGTMEMMSKEFNSINKANKFADELIAQGFEYVAVSGWVGAFGQRQYKVEWR